MEARFRVKGSGYIGVILGIHWGYIEEITVVRPQRYPPGFRTPLGLLKPYIILISSLNLGGGTFGGVLL